MSEHVEPLDVLIDRMAGAHAQARDRGQASRHARMRAGLEARLSPSERAPRWRWATATGVVLAMATVALLLLVMPSPAPLTFEVASSMGHGEARAFVVAGDDRPLTMTFSNGSTVALRPSSRVHVATARHDGVDLVLESGTIDTELLAQETSSWRVDAGEYRVALTAADCTLRWLPQQQLLELEVRSGYAELEGPAVSGPRRVEPGERVVLGGAAQRGAAEAASTPARSEDAARPEPAAEPPASDEPSSHRAVSGSRRTSRRDPGARSEPPAAEDWRALARQGSYREALAAAESAGFSRLCATVDAEALLALSDAGRYAGRPARAREALLALRKRFAGTNAAAAAAFDLGRLEPGGCAARVRWFRLYLRERPRGSMAEAAAERIEECDASTESEARPSP